VDSQEEILCPWWERVSALIDSELPYAQQEMVLSHTQSCTTCAVLLNQQSQFETSPSPNAAIATRLSMTFPQRNTPQLRALLAIIGVLIILGSVPGFIRGNTDGNSFHDLRHLSIWQFAIGVGTLSAAISFRISRLLTVVISTFLLLTAVATVYDLLTGHRGPWTDSLHLVEIAAALAILRMVYPQLNLLKIRNRDLAESH
jgi:peptidoglycan/LPS O-acetylase OafA/YrhL